MKNLYILELSDRYENQVRLPYSMGLIWSYCKTIQSIRENYFLKELFYYKESIDDICDKIIEPDVIILSSFVWNWGYNKKIAIKIRRKYPDCLIICGGPHVPHNDQFLYFPNRVSPYWGYPLSEWFNNHPYFDIISSGEGEITISEILVENLNERNFKKIEGLVIREKIIVFI